MGQQESKTNTKIGKIETKNNRRETYKINVCVRGSEKSGKTTLCELLSGAQPKKETQKNTKTKPIVKHKFQWVTPNKKTAIKCQVSDVNDAQALQKEREKVKEEKSKSGLKLSHEDKTPVADLSEWNNEIYSSCDGCVFIFNLSKHDSWIYIDRYLPKVPKDLNILVVGNAVDIKERVVSENEVLKLIEGMREKGFQIHYLEASLTHRYGLDSICYWFYLPLINKKREKFEKQQQEIQSEYQTSLSEFDLTSKEETYEKHIQDRGLLKKKKKSRKKSNKNKNTTDNNTVTNNNTTTTTETSIKLKTDTLTSTPKKSKKKKKKQPIIRKEYKEEEEQKYRKVKEGGGEKEKEIPIALNSKNDDFFSSSNEEEDNENENEGKHEYKNDKNESEEEEKEEEEEEDNKEKKHKKKKERKRKIKKQEEFVVQAYEDLSYSTQEEDNGNENESKQEYKNDKNESKSGTDNTEEEEEEEKKEYKKKKNQNQESYENKTKNSLQTAFGITPLEDIDPKDANPNFFEDEQEEYNDFFGIESKPAKKQQTKINKQPENNSDSKSSDQTNEKLETKTPSPRRHRKKHHSSSSLKKSNSSELSNKKRHHRRHHHRSSSSRSSHHRSHSSRTPKRDSKNSEHSSEGSQKKRHHRRHHHRSSSSRKKSKSNSNLKKEEN
ncbi:ras gtpase-related [Anaeramoeba flamelloides]|uniref:Ras gtpase-related n=1 Tax=Anaeramoeba flamelloides TaxID=1746091 RepID=A0AAV7ZVL5_9EUKA|nr:ras gtpase-related [Anaeramoeba flamelloides]